MERKEKTQILKEIFVEEPDRVLLVYALIKMGIETFTFKYKGKTITLSKEELLECAKEIYEQLWKEIFEGEQA